MKAFLEQLADEIYGESGRDPGNLCIVLPNRRAGLFLKEFLADRYKRNFFAPEIYSIEDFFVKFSGHILIDQVGLMFELYQVYLELNPENPQDFESFAPWGQVLLNDFNELDLYLADPYKIFRDISDTRALSVWNLDERPLTPFEKNYIDFYRSLLDYYVRLKERLLANGVIYKGLAHRILAENIEEISQSFPWEKIYFAGLNALSTSEENVIRFLLDKKKAEIYWDADKYYLDDPFQESGNFIRQYIKNFHRGPVKWIGEHFREEKQITVTGVPGHTGQAVYAGHLLKELNVGRTIPLHHTAVVLADEQMLIPMLNSLPEEIDSFNITMGFPLKLTPLYHFLQLLFKLHTGSERIRSRYGHNDNRFFVRDMISLLTSPYLRLSGQDTAKYLDRVVSGLNRSGKVIYSAGSILNKLQGLPQGSYSFCQLIFTDWGDPEKASGNLQALLEELKNGISKEKHKDVLEMEYVFHLARLIRRIKGIIDQHPFIRSLKSLEKVIFQLLGSHTLPFFGEPLSGLQMMGVLETRAIDFEEIIVLSVNEGILPRGKTHHSFIPFDIKRNYELPTHREKDAIFAYHFYRLLQRARRIHLVYETEGTRLGGGEKSRFITQLLHELPQYSDTIKTVRQVISLPPFPEGPQRSIVITKTPAIRAKLLEKSSRGLSPSALNTFIHCPLRFYFQEVAGLREPEEVEETIEVMTLGEVVHLALHLLFKKYEGRTISPGDVRSMQDEAENALATAFQEKYPEGDLGQGKNLLVAEVAAMMVKKYLSQQEKELKEMEGQNLHLKILQLERFLETLREIRFEGGQLAVKLKGKADRIDLTGGTLKVIDYKTGSVKPAELAIHDWDALVTDPKHGKAFQLLLYAYLVFKDSHSPSGIIESGNISLREPGKGFLKVKLPENAEINGQSMNTFEERLTELLERIYDPATVFDQTEDLELCRYCSFKGICRRL
jgi:RecB family exonuclease